MKIDYLVSTMNQPDASVVGKMNIAEENYTVINQVTDGEMTPVANVHAPGQKFLSVRDKGLSKSRNMAIRNSDGDICVVCDDDMEYTLPAKDIARYYDRYPQADLILFKVDGTTKSYWDKPTEVGFVKSMKAMSVEITFRRDRIVSNGIRFDEDFGAGAKYFLGEENIFLWDCLRNDLKIVFVSDSIGTLHNDRPSSWFTGYNSSYFVSKGAVFSRMSSWFYTPLVLQFAIRKHKEYHHEVRFSKAITDMWKGRKELMKDS